MRARFLFASAVLGGTVCSSCFIPGFTVGSDSASSGGTSTGGRATGGDGSAGEGGSAAHTGGAGGDPSCETIDPPAGLTLRAVQGASPYEFELPASVVASASQSSRGFAVSLDGTRLRLEAPSTFFGWDTVGVTFEEGCTTLRLRVSPQVGGALEELADGVLTGLPSGGALSLAAVDTDGDGRAELVVGAPSSGGGAGTVYVLRGAARLLKGSRDIEDIGTSALAGFTVTGAPGDAAGTSVSSSGDVDCSGKGSILIGAPNNARAYLLGDRPSGSVVELGAAPDDVFVLTGATGSQLGFSVAGGRDVNGDGVSDIVLGAPTYNASTGLVTVLFGGFVGCACDDDCAASPLDTTAPGTRGFLIDDSVAGWQLGRHVELLGSIVGNSFADLGLATNNRFILVEGRAETTNVSSQSGAGVSFVNGQTILSSAVPGFDGDDQNDYAYCQGTTCRVIRGAGGGAITIDGFQSAARVTLGGKVNDDGREDLIAFEGETAWIVFGRSAGSGGATVSLANLQGSSGFALHTDSGQVSAATALGDWDGDGFDDVAIADSANGKVYLLSGGP